MLCYTWIKDMLGKKKYNLGEPWEERNTIGCQLLIIIFIAQFTILPSSPRKHISGLLSLSCSRTTEVLNNPLSTWETAQTLYEFFDVARHGFFTLRVSSPRTLLDEQRFILHNICTHKAFDVNSEAISGCRNKLK